MAVRTGRNAKACIGTTTIADVTSYTFSYGSELLKDFVFGNSGFQTVAGQGGIEVGGSMNFLINLADTDGQNVIETYATVSGSEGLEDFRLYLSDTEYWTTSSGSKTYFANYTAEASANDIVRGSVDFQMDGPCERV